MQGQEDSSPLKGNEDPPRYEVVAGEVELFQAAFSQKMPVMLQGPTGCGKTRLVEHMAHRLGVDLHTVSCHEDLTASDLLGRFVLEGGNTVWVDGPLTRAVKGGGICYLDEVVEARQDATVAIHSVTDHRRELNLERLGGLRLQAAPDFMLVVSYNPGYQSVLKDLKPSTKQRMVGIRLSFPPEDVESRIVRAESAVSDAVATDLVRLAGAMRRATEAGLTEVASTRTLITAARLMGAGVPFRDAAIAAIATPLSDDAAVFAGLLEVIDAFADSA